MRRHARVGLRLGKSAGSAMPLVWAHAEYLKLLRSVTDGRVFDRISVVEERYASRESVTSWPSRSSSLSRQIGVHASGKQASLCWPMTTSPGMDGR